MTAPILCLAVTPAVQRTQFLPALRPGEVNRMIGTHVTASGKGVNVALALRRLGAPVRLVGLRGGDSGRFIEQELAGTGIDARWADASAPTRHCHTLVEIETGRVTELVEETASPSREEWEQVARLFADALSGCGWLAISGAMPPGSPPGELARFCARAASARVNICVDSQGPPLLECLATRPTIVKMNVEELVRTCGCASSPGEISRAARGLIDRGAGSVVITDGPRGATLFTKARTIHAPAPSVRVVNPIGSGDCMTAGLLFALNRGAPSETALRLGVACGSANAETEVPADFTPPAG